MTLVGLALVPGEDFREAVAPLFEEGCVDALSWGPDCVAPGSGPAWYEALLDHYAASGRATAHAVHGSLFTVGCSARRERWFDRIGAACARRSSRRISEHLGFMVVDGWERGAPLPLPLTAETRALGVERLQRLAETTGLPVGVENLALAFSEAEAWEQGPFLADMLAEVDGFLVLDLHNLWCQAVNFEVDAAALLASHPLGHVREIHISGGSWSRSPNGGERPFRRDTHDDLVPDEVLELCQLAVAACPALDCVIVERLDGTLAEGAARAAFAQQFRRVRSLVGADA